MSAVPELQRGGALRRPGRFAAVAERLRYPLVVYLASRVVYLAVAVADVFIRGYPLGEELRNWDGSWYVQAANNGYPHVIPHVYGLHGWSTLGFEPLYPMLMWFSGAVLPRGVEASGLLISLVCGAIATVEIAVLAERWFGRAGGRRAVLFFCFFPGTIVFSMVYSEGLTLALVAGAMLCLDARRWVWAGLLGAVATAVEPVAFAIIPTCAVVAGRELWRGGGGVAFTPEVGWRQAGSWVRTSVAALFAGLRVPSAHRALWAPALSPLGSVGFGIFLWSWVGTPLASFDAQRIAWGEKSSILAIPIQIQSFIGEFVNWHGWSGVNLNLPVGLVGAVFMVWALVQLHRYRRGLGVEPMPGSSVLAPARPGVASTGQGVPLSAWVWTIVVAVLTVTSDKTPPNPRMLICAFPLLLAVGAPRIGASQRILLGIALVLLVAMSIGSFAGGGLRP